MRATWRLLVPLCLAAGGALAQQRPELVVQTGHSGHVTSIAWSPDGRIVASGSVDQSVRLWDVENGIELRALQGHGAAVQAVAVSPDGRVLASAGTDNDIRLWSIATGQSLRTLQAHEMTVTSLAYSADGRILASAGMDQTIRIWDTASGRLLHTLLTDAQAAFRGFVLLALSPDGRTLASGGEITKLWDVASGRELRVLRARATQPTPPGGSMAFSRDGRTLAISGRTVQLLDVASGRTLWETPPLGAVGDMESLEFSPDGRMLVGVNTQVTFWDAASGRVLRQFPPLDYTARGAMSPDGRRLLLAGGSTTDFALRVLDAADGATLRSLTGHTSPVTSIALSRDGRLLASGRRTNVANSDTLKLWDIASGQLRGSLSGSNHRVNDVAFSADSRRLASGGGLRMGVWDTATGAKLRELDDRGGQVDILAYSADGRLLASGERNGTIRLWDATSGQRLRELKGHARAINALVFSPDGTTLASGGHDHLVRLWSTAIGAELRALSGHTDDVSALAFSADGRLLASSGVYQRVLVWNASTGGLVRSLPARPGGNSFRVDSLAFSPDGRLLAGGVVPLLSPVGGAVVWEVESASLRAVLPGAASISSVAFSADGRFIAGGSSDSTVRLWDAQSSALLGTLIAIEAQDWLVVTPDGLFDGSPAAWNKILWRFSPQLFDVAPVELYFNEYYHPGLLAELVAGRRPRAAASIEQRDRRQARVRLTAPATSARTVKVRLEVDAAPAGAQDLRLFRNGSLVRAWRGDVLQGQPQRAFEAEVVLTAGANRLTAYAFNRDNVKSADAILNLGGAPALARSGTAWLLAVGIDRYANAQFDLGFAGADARDFAAEFRAQQARLKRYARFEVVELRDARATKAGILQALQGIAARAQPEDAVVIYYAGHGTAEENQFYLIPHDLGFAGDRSRIDDAGVRTVLAHSISDRELERVFEGVDAGHILLVIDACNSGQALEAAEKRRGPMNSKGLAQLAYEKGMYVLAAAQSYQAAIEPADLKHGLLTYALVEEGLKRSAADMAPQDERILLREWLDYATERVPQIQRERMQKAAARSVPLAYVEGEERIADAQQRGVQRPRVFYRRELESQPLIVRGKE